MSEPYIPSYAKMILEYLADNTPSYILKIYSEKKETAKSKGEIIPLDEIKSLINKYILRYNEFIINRSENLDYTFMDQLDDRLLKIYQDDEDRGISYDYTSKDICEHITHNVQEFHNSLVTELEEAFYPFFTPDKIKELKIGLSLSKWYNEYSNEPFARSERARLWKEKNRKTVWLQVNDVNVEYEIERGTNLIWLVHQQKYMKGEREAILTYNFDMKIKNWEKNVPLGSEEDFLESEISRLGLKIDNLAIPKLEHTEHEALDCFSAKSDLRFQLKLANEKLKNKAEIVITEKEDRSIKEVFTEDLLITAQLEKFKEAFDNEASYLGAIEAVNLFFRSNSSSLKKPFFVKSGHIKSMAFAMGEIWRSKSNDPITYEYLLLYKHTFSIFKNQKIDKKNIFTNNLYKYSKSMT